MKIRQLKAFCAAGAIAVAAATGPAVAGPQDDTLRAAMTEEILNLDYNYTTKREYIILAQLTDATLFDIDPVSQEFRPAIATGYEWIDDLTLDLTLRDDVQFHDGTVLTPEDVAYTYNWIADEQSESNANGVVSRWLDEAVVTGPNMVRFKLKSVYPLVLRDMANRVMLRKAGTYGEGDGINRDAMANSLIATGPYKVTSFEPGTELVLERNEAFFGEKPGIKTIVVRNIPDIGTQQAELMSGGIDWMFKVPLDLAESLGATPMATHLSGPDLRVGFMVLDAAGHTDPDGPLTNVLVRRAISHALNTPDMAEHLIGGSAEPIHAACHPAQFGCDQSVVRYEYDPEKAKALLAEAGYPDGFPMEVWAYRDKAASEAIAADLTAVGIDVNLRYVKLESLNQARAAREIPAYFGTWGSGGTADTAAIARIHFDIESDRNMSGDAALAELVLSAEQTAEQEQRKAIYSQALGIIADQAYWAPLFSYSANYLVSPNLDFPLDPDGMPRLQNATWK